MKGGSYYQPFLHLWVASGGLSRHPLYDAQGRVRRVVDDSAVQTDFYTHNAFGYEYPPSGTTPNPYRFGGAWGYIADPSGMLQLGARFYWPEVGRFVARDPDIVHSPARLADVQNRMRSRRTGGFPSGPAVELGVHRAAIREALLRQALPGTRAETAYDYAQGRPTASFDPTGLISEQACDWICLGSCSVGWGALCSLCLNIPPPFDYKCLEGCIPIAATLCVEWCYHICDPCDRC
jgi:RHS repeat-associated protein